MDELRTEIENAIAEVINTLSLPVGNQDLDLCVTRLEVLAENALSCDGIPLEVVDLLNQAVSVLKRNSRMERSHDSYQAPLLSNERNRGRPKFAITEDQLLFFKGTLSYG